MNLTFNFTYYSILITKSYYKIYKNTIPNFYLIFKPLINYHHEINNSYNSQNLQILSSNCLFTLLHEIFINNIQCTMRPRRKFNSKVRESRITLRSLHGKRHQGWRWRRISLARDP